MRPVRQGIDRPLPAANQLVEAVGVAAHRSRDELLVGDRQSLHGQRALPVCRSSRWDRPPRRVEPQHLTGRPPPAVWPAPVTRRTRRPALSIGRPVGAGRRRGSYGRGYNPRRRGRGLSVDCATDETFLTTEEVLEYLQVNLRTVYRLIKAGKIPAVRVGRQWRFRKRDIDAWLDSQRPRGGRAAAGRRAAAGARRAAARASSSSTTRRASAICWRRRSRRRIRRRRGAGRPRRRSSGCGCTLRPADRRPEDARAWTASPSSARRSASRPTCRSSSSPASRPRSSAIEAVNLGVAGYLTKPFRVPQVARPPRAQGASASADAMIQLSTLTKSFGDRVLLDHVTWQIGDRERVGLCGPNGAGKTTLLRMLAGLDEPDGGAVVKPAALTVGYLPQDGLAHAGRTRLRRSQRAPSSALLDDQGGDARRSRSGSATRRCREAEHDAMLARYSDLQDRFRLGDGYSIELQDRRRCCSGLGFTTDGLRAADRDVLGRLADAHRARQAAARPAEPAAARRADESPRPRGAQLARGVPRRLSARRHPRLARPLLPRRGRHAHRRPARCAR